MHVSDVLSLELAKRLEPVFEFGSGVDVLPNFKNNARDVRRSFLADELFTFSIGCTG